MAWEYKILAAPQLLPELQTWLNDLGKEDWELVWYTEGTLAIFKRKLTGPTKE